MEKNTLLSAIISNVARDALGETLIRYTKSALQMYAKRPAEAIIATNLFFICFVCKS